MTKRKERIGRPVGHKKGCRCFVCASVDKRPKRQVKSAKEVAQETLDKGKPKQPALKPLEECLGGASLNDAQVKDLALDLYKGTVFTDRHLSKYDDITMCFMVIALLDEAQRKSLRDNPPGMIYEYLHKAGSRSVNGNPCFMSACMIDGPSTKKVFAKYEEIKKTMEAV